MGWGEAMAERTSADRSVAGARLAASWLLAYPGEELRSRLDTLAGVIDELPSSTADPLRAFLDYLGQADPLDAQAHYVAVFDMKRKACPYLSYWTDGDTRMRGQAILRFKQAYLEAGFELDDSELPDHLAVVLEFAAVCDALTGDALLSQHAHAIGLLRDALASMSSPYAAVIEAVLATMPKPTAEVLRRIQELAAAGPATEQVGLEPFGRQFALEPIGVRR